MKPLILALAWTAALLLASYFILLVVSYANAATRPRAATLAPPPFATVRPLPCVACVSLMAPPERP